MRRSAVVLSVTLALAAARGEAADARGLPLPPAPIRVLVPDVPAFDAVLTGAYRRALLGAPHEDDAVVAAWRRTQVGSKLEDQWTKLASDLSWTWGDVLKLKPRTLGLSLLAVGSLEAVFVIDLPAATAVVPLPAGSPRTSPSGASYALVARGAGDATDGDRRMGLAWARSAGRLFLATSERALLAALDESASGREWAPPLTGIVAMELDVAALEKDRYFVREFLFGARGGGSVAAALRVEDGRLVEVRQGQGEAREPAVWFDSPEALAAGWEDDPGTFWPALRAGLLEPAVDLPATPVPPLAPLPEAAASMPLDRYLVDLRTPPAGPAASYEEGDLRAWRDLLSRAASSGWGYRWAADGARTLVFPWPASLMEDLARACRATIERRGGRASEHQVGEAHELRIGPGLPVLAWRRAGELVWLGRSAASLAQLPSTRRENDLVRWARVDLGGLRKEGERWGRLEGPASPETTRPFSDRILGLLGWMPGTRSLSVERRQSRGGWTERVSFGAASGN